MKRTIFGVVCFLFACCAYGQVDRLSFEVATVKPSGPRSVRRITGGPEKGDPERFSFTGMALDELLTRAYGLADFSLVSGPGWISKETYDVAGKIPPGTTKEQFQKMLQALLTERFQLVLQHNSKMLPVYELVVAKNGPKLKESLANSATAPAPATRSGPVTDQNGFPNLPSGRPGLTASSGPGGVNHWTGHQAEVPALAAMLSTPTGAGRTVFDKTGLTGKYDFELTFGRLSTSVASGVENVPTSLLPDALQDQLGLKLVDAKAPFDTIVVDRAEKVPTEN
ncbi:MAG: TIGR03435 family protein [Acidobacteriota bacterium]